jgi:hypothetical protein
MRPPVRHGSASSLGFFVLLLIGCSGLSAQTYAAGIPAHAHARGSGAGWACDGAVIGTMQSGAS